VAYETFERQLGSSGEPALTVAPGPDARITLNAAAARLMEKAGVAAEVEQLKSLLHALGVR